MLVTRIVIFAALLLLLSSSIRADSFAVIFGSFVNQEFAKDRKTQLENILDEAVTVNSIEIDGTRYHRTLVRFDQRGAARRLLERSARLNVKGGWILHEQMTSVISNRVSSQRNYGLVSVSDKAENAEPLNRSTTEVKPDERTSELQESSASRK